VPLVAPLGTAAEIWLASVTEKVAVVPLNFTLVAPVKFVPVSVTLVPVCPLAGEKLVIVDAATLTVKLLAEVAVPCGVTIEIFPVTAPLGTVAVTLVALTTVNVAAAPPIVTEVAPLKCVPVTVTEIPALPLVGLKLLIVGVADGCVGGAVLVLPPPQPRNIPAHAIAKKIAVTIIARGILFCVVRGAIGLRRNITSSLARVLHEGLVLLPRRATISRVQPPWTLPSRIVPQASFATCPKGQFSFSRII